MATQRKRDLDLTLINFLRHVSQTFFYEHKNKGKLFFDEKSRGPLLVRVAFNNEVRLSEAMFSKNVL